MNVPAPDPMDMSIEFVSSYLYHSTEQVSDTDLERQLLLLAEQVAGDQFMAEGVLSALAHIASTALIGFAEMQRRPVDQVWPELAEAIRSAGPDTTP
jgi:hypothetical protein